jgi:hypothetical protein
MAIQKKSTTPSTEKKKPAPSESGKHICFVISPIGKEGTEVHQKFKDVLEYVIKKAIKGSGYQFEVLRADDINRSGSFIRDILDSIYSSHVVIADLTGQNPNVFYELGVRHSLSPRTILIAQSIDDIPSDLREYRTIVYETSAKGAAQFQGRLTKYLEEIYKDGERPDNPVLDRLPAIAKSRDSELEREILELKAQLSSSLQSAPAKAPAARKSNASERMKRILNLVSAKQQYLAGTFSRGEKSYVLPERQGNFHLYFLHKGTQIVGFWYCATYGAPFDPMEELADVRVLMENCSQGQNADCRFIIATEEDLAARKTELVKTFSKMNALLPKESQSLFELDIWDRSGLEATEKKYGLRF